MSRAVTGCIQGLLLGLAGAMSVLVAQAQPPPQGPPPPEGPPPFHGPAMDDRRLGPMAAELEQRLHHTAAVNATAQRALELSKTYLQHAEKALAHKQYFPADRLLSASEALRRVAEYQNPQNAAELREPPNRPFRMAGPEFGHGPPPNGPRGPLPGDPMEHLYFRLRQADFFAAQSHDPEAPGLAQWAREFYQQARVAAQHGDPLQVAMNARSAEEIVHALESLAQAVAPYPPPGPGGPGRGPDDGGPDGHGPGPPPPGMGPGGPPPPHTDEP